METENSSFTDDVSYKSIADARLDERERLQIGKG